MGIRAIDPTAHMGGDAYIAEWQYLFAHVFVGFWARFIAVVFLFLAFYFGIRRRSLQMFAMFFICALFITFIAPVLKFTGLLST